MTGPLVDFYAGTAGDDSGRSVSQILAQDDDWLEATHDFIQWLFPLRERSRFHPAPTLDDAQVEAFGRDPALRERLAAAFERMLRFYGFRFDGSGARVVRAAEFEGRAWEWITPGNHNFLRITRILKCLVELGLEQRARAFFDALSAVYADHEDVIGERTFDFWKDAAGR